MANSLPVVILAHICRIIGISHLSINTASMASNKVVAGTRGFLVATQPANTHNRAGSAATPAVFQNKLMLF